MERAPGSTASTGDAPIRARVSLIERARVRIAGTFKTSRASAPSRARAADLVVAALPAARARAFAEANLFFLAGFILDDLQALRVPGFIVGIALAVLALGFGSAFHSRRLARRVEHLPPIEVEWRLDRATVAHRAGAFLSALLLFGWLFTTTGGVDLWPL